MTDSSFTSTVPSQRQLEAYCGLFRIEVFLRELVIDELSRLGPQWRRQCIPPDVRESMRNGIASEKSAPMQRVRLLDPIYYTDFPDLKKIIVKGDNWETIFRHVFPNKDIIAAKLLELEPIRNAVAHSRSISQDELELVKVAETYMLAIVGKDQYRVLSQRESRAPSVADALARTYAYCASVIPRLKLCETIEEPSDLITMHDRGLLDEVFLGISADLVVTFLRKINAYRRLPRRRGEGHLIEHFCRRERLEALAEDTQALLKQLLS